MIDVNELADIAFNVSQEMGYSYSPEEVEYVLRYTERKAEVCGNGEDYIPILFETELKDYLMRAAISVEGLRIMKERQHEYTG